jgi:biotin-[acetyl-CoA-carboxylase] ligase BirA-like protein
MATIELHQVANRVIESCVSTNDLARGLGESGYPHGTWVSARIQTRGRGRLGREWISLEGNLFISVLIRLPNPEFWTWVPLTAAVAVVGVIKELFPEFSPEIKWPNDLCLSGRKLGGILCEGVGNSSDSFIVVGLGLNCAAHPNDLNQPTICLAKKDLDLANRLRPRIISAMLEEFSGLVRSGSARVAKLYRTFAALKPGAEIQWKVKTPEAESNLPTHSLVTLESGRVIRLGKSGELQICRSDGELISLFAEEVSIRVGGERIS